MVIGTTSMKSVLGEMDVVDCFNVCLSVPCVTTADEIEKVLSQFSDDSDVIKQISDLTSSTYMLTGIPIKNLMLAIDISL